MAKVKKPRTAAQKAAWRKTQEAAWKSNKGRKRSHYKAKRNVNRRHYSSDNKKRGTGVAGLKKNTTPYLRVNKRSQTLGTNTGTIIPFTQKRIAIGSYIRVENTNRKNALDATLGRVGNKVAPRGTKRGAARKWIKESVHIDNPGLRANVGRAQVRLGTSRNAGPTIILRKGQHKTFEKKSRGGIKMYNTRMTTIRKRRKARRGR
jgi:hypothetical protein